MEQKDKMSQASDRDWTSNPPKTKEEYAEFKRYQNMIDYFKGFGKIDTTEIDQINDYFKKDDEDE